MAKNHTTEAEMNDHNKVYDQAWKNHLSADETTNQVRVKADTEAALQKRFGMTSSLNFNHTHTPPTAVAASLIADAFSENKGDLKLVPLVMTILSNENGVVTYELPNQGMPRKLLPKHWSLLGTTCWRRLEPSKTYHILCLEDQAGKANNKVPLSVLSEVPAREAKKFSVRAHYASLAEPQYHELVKKILDATVAAADPENSQSVFEFGLAELIFELMDAEPASVEETVESLHLRVLDVEKRLDELLQLATRLKSALT